ncbi:2-C-methyl-D-erythritol 4-phosphate cytidylyltransferase [Arthrobacter sp. UM1]|nr:2-C-methyl-D-erythritol 4-phosphate cytidylyltransferase [Arthrobacter sp. UM1]
MNTPEGAAVSAAPSGVSGEEDVAVLLAAAGQGTRLGAGMPKALALLAGEPLVVHALRGVLAALPGAQVVILHPPAPEQAEALKTAVESAFGEAAAAFAWAPGGQERSDSVRSGLEAVRRPIVLVHDCARALTPPAVFAEVAEAVRAGADGAIPAVPVVDTVKAVSEDGTRIESTPARSRLRAVQTPQGFRTDPLRAAHAAASELPSAAATDDSMLMEAAGGEVRLVAGHPDALKITSPIDLVIAEHVLAARRPRPDQSRPDQPRPEPGEK